jgi:glyoxylase-like metal-dependent hydrolase (beta-lactamase superfamily II)
VRIQLLRASGRFYSSNAYLIMGEWKGLGDPNTLVDVGTDVAVLDHLEQLDTGVGKPRIERVVLTHTHSDHTALLPEIRARYQPTVYAFSRYQDGVDHVLSPGEHLRLGDCDFEVIHTPGHSTDSICLFNETEGVLFAGDSPVLVRSAEDIHEEGFVNALSDICRRNVRKIYFGHGEPVVESARDLLLASLANVREAYDRAGLMRAGAAVFEGK